MGEEGAVATTSIEMARLQVFDGTLLKVSEFVIVYMQEGSANVWKKNTLEDLEEGLLEYEIVEEFLADIRKKFRERYEELAKVVELKKLE